VPLRQALSLDDTLDEAHVSQSIVSLAFDWDWDKARREILRALSLSPGSSLAHHWYSHFLVATGNFPESLAESKRALDLDPVNVRIVAHLTWHYYYARGYQQAIEAAEKSLEIDPNDNAALVYFKWALEGAGRFEQAIDVWQRIGASPQRVAAL